MAWDYLLWCGFSASHLQDLVLGFVLPIPTTDAPHQQEWHSSGRLRRVPATDGQGPKAITNDDYAAVVIDVPNASNPRKGHLLRDVGYVEKQSVLSTYDFSDDGILTITTRYDTNVGIERCWFVTDQVRMRVSSVQCLDGVSMTTYCTEFRCPSDEDIRSIAMQAQSLKANTPAPII